MAWATCVVVWLVTLSLPAGRFDGQLVSPLAHLAWTVAFSMVASAALRGGVRQRRPRWFWPVSLLFFGLGGHDLIRVVNARGGGPLAVHTTSVMEWKTKRASWRGSGHDVRWVTVVSWEKPEDRLTFRVPEGALTRAPDFAATRRAHLEAEWRSSTLERLKAEQQRRLGELGKLMEELGAQPTLPAFPEPSLEALMYPVNAPCEVSVQKGLLGLSMVTGVELLNTHDSQQSRSGATHVNEAEAPAPRGSARG